MLSFEGRFIGASPPELPLLFIESIRLVFSAHWSGLQLT